MRAGLYEHFKGGTYLVIGVGLDANADEWEYRSALGTDEKYFDHGRDVVVYVGHGDELGCGPRMFVRTVDDFNQKLCGVDSCRKPLDGEDRCPEHGHTNYQVRRFEYVGPRG